MAATATPSWWGRVLRVLGLRVGDAERERAAEAHARGTRDHAVQERNDRRGPPIVGG